MLIGWRPSFSAIQKMASSLMNPKCSCHKCKSGIDRAATVLARITRDRRRPFSAPVRREFGCASRLPSLNLTQRSDTRQIAFRAVESAVLSGMMRDAGNPACESGADRIVCLTADQSESVLSFDCTLSSLKTIVTVSLP